MKELQLNEIEAVNGGVAPIAVIIGYGVRTYGPKAVAATAGFIAGWLSEP